MGLETRLIDKCAKCGKEVIRDRQLLDSLGLPKGVLCDECSVDKVESVKEKSNNKKKVKGK